MKRRRTRYRHDVRRMAAESLGEVAIRRPAIRLFKMPATLLVWIDTGQELEAGMLGECPGVGVDVRAGVQVQVVAHADLPETHDQDRRAQVSPLR